MQGIRDYRLEPHVNPDPPLEEQLQDTVRAPRYASDMDDLIKDFLQESGENLDHLDQDFVKLESDPDNRESRKSIFRTIRRD